MIHFQYISFLRRIYKVHLSCNKNIKNSHDTNFRLSLIILIGCFSEIDLKHHGLLPDGQ